MNRNKFLYQQPDAITRNDDDIIGSQYAAGVIVLDWRWCSDDEVELLLVESDEEEPFVITKLHLDSFDVRHDSERRDMIRYALIAWEA